MVKDTGEILRGFEDEREGKMIMRRLFPAGFTMVCVVLFIVPCYLAVYAARHPVAKYFCSEWYFSLIVIPVLILFVHFVHTRNGPDKYMTHLALLIPSILLLVYGTTMLATATSRADKLFSTDCNIMLEKMHLQREWEAAHLLYQSCLEDTAAARNLTASYLAKNFRIQDCTEYQDSLEEHRRDWKYLQQLEEKHACTGFCTTGEQLWSKGPHKDSCAIAVASVFRYVVRGNFLQVVALSLFTLCVDMAMVIFTGQPRDLKNAI